MNRQTFLMTGEPNETTEIIMDNNTINNSSASGQSEWIHTDSSQPPLTCGRMSRYLKGEARNALLGHLGTIIGANLLYAVITYGISFLVSAFLPSTVVGTILAEIFSIILGILYGIFEYGLITIYMNLQYGQLAKVSDLFNGFRENSDKIILVEAYLVILETLVLLPSLIAYYAIPGDVGYSAYIVLNALGSLVFFFIELHYMLSLYILLDFPDMEWKDVLKKSRSMMKGYKKRWFYVELSFLPLYLLSILTLGIASVLVMGYEQATMAAFYKGRMENKLM